MIILDASQSAGNCHIDVVKDEIDILAFTGHKSLFGITGVGGLYIKKNIKLAPLKVGGTGIRSDLLLQPPYRPTYYEAGTKNYPGIISLYAGISFILETGLQTIIAKKNKLCKIIIEEFEKISNIILNIDKNEPYFSMVCFNIKNQEPEDVGYILENSFGIMVRSGLHCAPLIHKNIATYPKGCVRVSPSFFTTKEEITLFIDAIQQTREM